MILTLTIRDLQIGDIWQSKRIVAIEPLAAGVIVWFDDGSKDYFQSRRTALQVRRDNLSLDKLNRARYSRL